MATATKIVAVEGSIGSGKSTCVNHYTGHKKIHIHKESLDHWRTVKELRNKESKRWSFLFNQYALLSRLKLALEPTNKPVKLVETSLQSTFHVFAEANHKNKDLTFLEYNVLKDFLNFLTPALNIKIDYHIYLQLDPELSFERMKKRMRGEESNITLDFLKDLHILHEHLFVTHKEMLSGEVLVVDATKPISELHDIYDNFLHKKILKE